MNPSSQLDSGLNMYGWIKKEWIMFIEKTPKKYVTKTHRDEFLKFQLMATEKILFVLLIVF